MFVNCEVWAKKCCFHLIFNVFQMKANLFTLRKIHTNLAPILNEDNAPLDVIAFTAISLGLVYVGSCNEEVAQAIICALMERSESE